MYSYIAKHMMAPVMDVLRGTETMKCLNELEKTQWWSREKILELQNQRLLQLVRHAHDNVPYYRRMFDERALKPNDIKHTGDLSKLPVLNKSLIRNNFNEIMARGFPAKEMFLHSTSGSTGEPLVFYNTKEAYLNWGSAASQRAYQWAGYEIGKKCVSIRTKPVLPSTWVKVTEKVAKFLERAIFFNVAEMAVGKIPLFVKKLGDFQPEFIMTYPSALYLLARYIEKEGLSIPRPKAIITTAEQLFDYQRELFFKVFGCETFSHYSAWETFTIASECSAHSGHHIAAEKVVVEVVDDEGKPVTAGKEGRILLTNLFNYAMPLIRYEIGDLGIASDNVCPCGRGLPLLATINGRIRDTLLTRQGMPVPGAVLGGALAGGWYATLGIEQFQIMQEIYEKVVVKVVLDGEYPQSHVDKVVKEITSRYSTLLGEDMEIVIEFVDEIPRTESGKMRVVISNVPVESD